MSHVTKYVMIKVKGLKHPLWFLSSRYEKKDDCTIFAYDGWGRNGAYIEKFQCDISEIVAEMTTNELQY